VLRALATQKLLQERKFFCRCAARKPAVHANRGENDTPKNQVAGRSCPDSYFNDRLAAISAVVAGIFLPSACTIEKQTISS
jgi:hypothetical protein